MNCWVRDDTSLWCNIITANILLGEQGYYFHVTVIVLCLCLSKQNIFFFFLTCSHKQWTWNIRPQGYSCSTHGEKARWWTQGPRQGFCCCKQMRVFCQSRIFLNKMCKPFGHSCLEDHPISWQFQHSGPCSFCIYLSVPEWKLVITSFLELLQYKQIKWFCVS